MQFRAFLIILVLGIGGILQVFGQAEEFSEATASKVFQQVKSGVEGRNERRLLSAFDEEKMDGYLPFQDKTRAFFRRYDPIRLYYRVLQTSMAGEKGVALLELQMEAEPADGNAPPVRKDQQVRVEFVRGKQGWKIVSWTPGLFGE